jgi:hypothetical protein
MRAVCGSTTEPQIGAVADVQTASIDSLHCLFPIGTLFNKQLRQVERPGSASHGHSRKVPRRATDPFAYFKDVLARLTASTNCSIGALNPGAWCGAYPRGQSRAQSPFAHTRIRARELPRGALQDCHGRTKEVGPRTSRLHENFYPPPPPPRRPLARRPHATRHPAEPAVRPRTCMDSIPTPQNVRPPLAIRFGRPNLRKGLRLLPRRGVASRGPAPSN